MCEPNAHPLLLFSSGLGTSQCGVFPFFCTCTYTIFQSFISIYVRNISGIDIDVELITSHDFVVLSVIFACCNLTAAGILWVALPLWFSLFTLCVMSCTEHRFADANITLSRIFCLSLNKIWQRESFSEDHWWKCTQLSLHFLHIVRRLCSKTALFGPVIVYVEVANVSLVCKEANDPAANKSLPVMHLIPQGSQGRGSGG